MNHRPKVIIPNSRLEKVHDLICGIVIIGMIVYTVQAIFQMPDTIPIHYNAKGEPDGWGSRWISLIMPLITVALYIPTVFLQKHPEKHNYPERLSESNAYAFYRHSKILISWIKLEIVLSFAYVNGCFVREARGHSSPPIWYVLIGFFLVVVTTIIMSVR
ncbi:putative membrane protein [Pullulanibacillus pueri]|uniref:DUF1648 domain-containing protein n=1 Tax=Pullulanibacillus pueri TaxID=1437324 RepID=A0A8J2ZWQ6_9BACL|nr:DUF1648 domain-containing protein [Pullulanibacillus pueri]MBM7682819.1 putative membrane protein [Pullulanibacillus pueri]GGH83310.1 hypothetical protein GCM10007096_23990 [Pullulanibacillus pueri]